LSVHGGWRDNSREPFEQTTDDLIGDTEARDANVLPTEADTLSPFQAPRREAWQGTSYAIINPRLLKDKEVPSIDATLVERAHPGVSAHGRVRRPGLWLRVNGGSIVGPLTFSAAMQAVRDARRSVSSARIEVTGDRKRWIAWSALARFVEEDAIDPICDFPPGAISGSLEQVSVVSLLGRLARKRATGRLTLVQASDRMRRTEIQLFEGLPTNVASSDPELGLFQQLIRSQIVSEPDLEACVQRSACEARALRQVISTEVHIDIAQYRAQFMRERMEPIFAVDRGTFGFVIEPPEQTSAFAPSLFGLLMPAIERVRRIEPLRVALASRRALPLKRTLRFRTIVPLLQLSEADRFAIDVFGRMPTLGESIAACPAGEAFAVRAAYVLTELGLLGLPRPPLNS
jgi:hypothetical protein